MVERKNRDLKAQLAILVDEKYLDWPDKLPSIRFAMDSARCSCTRYSAAYLRFGWELSSPGEGSQRPVTWTFCFVGPARLSEVMQYRRKTLAD